MRNKDLFLNLVILLFLSYSCFAQEASAPQALVLYTMGEEPLSIHLPWSGGENALYYRVEFQRALDGQTYRPFQDIETLNLYVDLTLPIGMYRFVITPYDSLGNPASETEWRYLEIRTSYSPELQDFSPKLFYLDADADWVVTILGSDLYEGAEISLRRTDEPGEPILPVRAEYNENPATQVDAYFEHDQLIAGIYEVHIVNPGGLEMSLGDLLIYDQRPVKDRTGNLWSLGISAGSSLAAPLLILTAHVTIAPFNYSFLEIGFDFGLFNNEDTVDYYSIFPYAHYAVYLPFYNWGGWYVGVGGGYMRSSYSFNKVVGGTVHYVENNPSFNVITGFRLFNILDISYTFRTNFTEVNNKVGIGYTYRFQYLRGR